MSCHLQSELAEVMIDYVESHGSDARGRLELSEFMYFFGGVSVRGRREE
jgi:hypothetical protein